MSFLHPGWLLLSLIIPMILLGAILAYRSRGKAWRQLVAPRLQKQLVREAPQTRRWISLSLGLLACLLLITVLARPYQGKTITKEAINTRNIIIAIDTSRSMLVNDGSPDRMTSAQAMALEMLQIFPNDRIGIIAFSGKALLLAPLTIDHGSIRETIAQLDTDVIPAGGSSLAEATQVASETFKKINHHSNALIIISDGEDHSKAIQNATYDIRDGNFAVSAITVGTTAGGMIPDPSQPDGQYRDVYGNAVHSIMIPDALATLAKAGGGTLTAANAKAPAITRDALAFLTSHQQKGRHVSLPNEKFTWFLIPAILCLIASMIMRSQLFSFTKLTQLTIGFLVLFTLHDTHAATDLKRATLAYENEQYSDALESFEKALKKARNQDRYALHFSAGSTAYKLKQWPQASAHFSKSLLSPNKNLRTASHYNIGNTLFQSAWSLFIATEKDGDQPTYQIKDTYAAITQLEDAITHYTEALQLNQKHQDAPHNRAEAEKLLRKIKKQQQEQQRQQEENQKEQAGNNPSKNPDKTSDPNNQGNEQGSNPQESDQQDPEQKPDQGDSKQTGNNSTNQQGKEKQQKPGETDEAYAARMLQENADSETRPTSKFLHLRRTNKDW